VLVRALLAFLLLPGIVAFTIPVFLVRQDLGGRRPGLVGVLILATGIVLLLWCVHDFYVAGKGTLAPWDPPRRLVRIGLYRYSRNPMYLSVIVILLGWTLAYQSSSVGIYSAIVAVAFHLRVILGEEPWLARTYGAAWQQYAAVVPRWIGPRMSRAR
jgi:protein-S-isoprenylcysteine O-methyltransferase Ste14